MAPLHGYTVVELSTGIAGAYCTKLLADGGARVIKVESPQGDPLRRWSASGADIDGVTAPCSDSWPAASTAWWPNRKTPASSTTCWQLPTRWCGRADSSMGESFSPAGSARRIRISLVTSITPFGLEGPWRDRPATEFTLQAWSGGIVGLGRGSADRAPVFVGGQVGDYLAGAYASAATLASRMRQFETGAGELLDLSMLEAHILGLTYYPVTFFEMLGRPWRDARKLTIPGIARAKDGLVDVGCGTAQQWFDLCAMIGQQDWIDEDSPLSITEMANLKADGDLRLVRERRTPTTSATSPPPSGSPTRRSPTAPTSPNSNSSSTGAHSSRTRATDSASPAIPIGCSPATLAAPQPAPRLGEHTAQYREPRPVTPRRPAAESQKVCR